MDTYTTANGQELTDETVDRWCEAYERGEFPEGERTVGHVTHGQPPKARQEGAGSHQGSPIRKEEGMESRLNAERALVSQRLYGLEFGGGSGLDLSLIGEAILGHKPEPGWDAAACGELRDKIRELIAVPKPHDRGEGTAGTNWELWFGTPRSAATSVSQLVDLYDARLRGEDFHSPFTDNFEMDGPCEYGLIHQPTLEGWLRKRCPES